MSLDLTFPLIKVKLIIITNILEDLGFLAGETLVFSSSLFLLSLSSIVPPLLWRIHTTQFAISLANCITALSSKLRPRARCFTVNSLDEGIKRFLRRFFLPAIHTFGLYREDKAARIAFV